MSSIEYLLLGPATLLFLANLAAASCLVCALALLAVHVCRRASAPLQYGLLLTVPVLLLASPLLLALAATQGWGAFRLSVPIGDELMGANGNTAAAPIDVAKGMSDLSSPGASNKTVADAGDSLFTWQAVGTLIAGVWGIGIVIRCGGLMRSLRMLARFRHSLEASGDERIGRAAAESLHRAGLNRKVPVLESRLAPTPLTLGFLKPVIVLPRDFTTGLSDEQLRLVLMHEAAHVRRFDHWAAALQYLAGAAFWWNPLVHFAARRMDRLREQICDDCAAGSHGEGRRLAEALLVVAERSVHRPAFPCAALLDGPAELEERVFRLLQSRPRVHRMSTSAWAAVVAFAAIAAVTLLVSAPQAAEPDPIAAFPSPEKRSPSDNQPGPESSGPAGVDLTGEWLLTLPRGFQHHIKLTPLGDDRYRFTPGKLTMSGVYKLQDGKLLMVEPNDKRLTEFKWDLQDGGLKLVDSPPVAKIGSDYRGATLKRAAR